MFINYSYESVGVSGPERGAARSVVRRLVERLQHDERQRPVEDQSRRRSSQLRRNPFLFDSFLIGSKGNRTISKVTPSYVFNTIDNPIFPANGKRVTLAMDIGGLGGNTSYLKPTLEGIWYHPHTSRSSFGGRVQFQSSSPIEGRRICRSSSGCSSAASTACAATISARLGRPCRTRRSCSAATKSLLFNGEYIITVAGPVRLVLFYDAGQVRDFGQKFAWKEDLTRQVFPAPPLLIDPFSGSPSAASRIRTRPGVHTEVIGRTSAFKTSTGAEIRFFMPVLNVPFRLIFAANPQRGGVLNNTLLPAKAFTFKFAVGSTF